jgi:phosphonate transport system permease protein
MAGRRAVPGRRASPLLRTVQAFVAIAILSAITGDIAITTVDPWHEFARMLHGVITPDFTATEDLLRALLLTVAFAVLGVALGAIGGFGLALLFQHRLVRSGCAIVRAVHELFWALIFLQLFGLSPLTGLLAIAIPYAGIFAKVYAEILEEADPRPLQALPAGSGRVSAFLFVRLPDAWHQVATYTLYRLECGLRSSAILGFVGLPTLGFHLESAFSQGNYSEVAALLFLFYVVIATIRWWMRKPLLPFWLVGAIAVLPWSAGLAPGSIARFFTHDIVPYPLRGGEGWAGMGDWLSLVLVDQALPGVVATLQLTMVALVATGALTLLFFPLISPLLFGRPARGVGHAFLVVVRSTPEYILAFILLQLWGPSMLPAIVALALHNGAIIGHLVGRFTEGIALRPDAPRGFDRYAWEIVPRVYRHMLALLFYRWEVILRETAILGMLGIATLGFYIDSAFADLRFDRALLLIAVTAGLNLAVDAASRAIRARLRLQTGVRAR